MPKYRFEYIYSHRHGNPFHTWTAIGAKGAVHLHITDHGEEFAQKYGDRYTGGFEIHWRFPPEYLAEDAPSQDTCWLLKCPCWHDGCSTYATDFWIPRWLAAPDDHDGLFQLLQGAMNERFADSGELAT